MPTQHDFLDAMMEGRWRPRIEDTKRESKDETLFVATYRQNKDTVLEATSKWSADQARTDLKKELREGVLQGKYWPTPD